MTVRVALLLALLGLSAPALRAQTLSGAVSTASGAFPNQNRTPELRSRVFAKAGVDSGSHVRFEIAGFAEGLLAGGRTRRTGATEVDEASARITTRRVDLLVGFSRVVWGRLDEVQPGDVVNPLDLSRFFFDSREAARMPVGLARGRIHFSRSTALELVAVPRFRKGRFDRLDEATSPFNPAPGAPPAAVRRPDAGVWQQMQGGARVTSTHGRVDWAVGAYRGFRPLPVYTASFSEAGPSSSAAASPFVVEGAHPRFTMVSGDFETAFSRWALRGEVVVSDEDAVQGRNTPISASGRSVQAGLGIDRAIAGYRVLGQVLWRTTSIGTPSLPVDPRTGLAPVFDTQSVAAVAVVDRRFARETRRLRVFGIYDAAARNGVVRGVAGISLNDGLWLEGATAWFAGRRAGFLGPFVDSDFVSVRLAKSF